MKRHVLYGLLLLFTTIFFVSFSPVPTFAYSYYDEDETTDGTEADDEDDTEDDTENIANDEDDEDEGFTVYFKNILFLSVTPDSLLRRQAVLMYKERGSGKTTTCGFTGTPLSL